MLIKNNLNNFVGIILIVFNEISGLSLNRPRFCPNAIWDPNGMTFPDTTTFDDLSPGFFIDTNNTIYISVEDDQEIVSFHIDNINLKSIIPINSTYPQSIFVTNIGDIYIDNGNVNHQIDKWISSSNILVTVMRVDAFCDSLFVDSNDTLYCSMSRKQKVMKTSLNDNAMASTIAAGTGIRGSASNELNDPLGIFVDINFDLYVADCRNHRIQLFQLGQLYGKTIIGKESLDEIDELNCPSAIVLDAEKNLFISDQDNNRIVTLGPNGFQCLIGCNKESSEFKQLSRPLTLSFDSFGNLYVMDHSEDRIEKFLVSNNSCNMSSIIQAKYSSALTLNHTTYFLNICDRLVSFYETIEVTVTENAYYVLSSNSNIDIYASIYKNIFYPLNPIVNRILEDGKCCNSEPFKITVYLEMNISYILVVTTYNPNVIGTFSVIVSGSHKVTLQRILNTSPVIELIYSSELTINHRTYSRTVSDCLNYYYEEIQLTVDKIDYYTLTSNSTIDIYGSIYENKFNSLNPFADRILESDRTCHNDYFRLIVRLEVNRTYILVVSTYNPDETGLFSVIVYGSNKVHVRRITNTPSTIQSIYSSVITTNHTMYSRTGCDLPIFYFEAIQLKVNKNDYYTMISSSTINTFGYIYKNEFDSLNPSINRILKDDDSCNNDQFKLIGNFSANITYIVIVTTHDPNVTGAFSIIVSGVEKVSLERLDISSVVGSIYSSTLTTNSQTYARTCGVTIFYYETIQIDVVANGSYSFSSNSSFMVYGYIYEGSFDPFNPFTNLISEGDEGCGFNRLGLVVDLHVNVTYILVVTTLAQRETGSFSIIASGPTKVHLKRIINNCSSCYIGGGCNTQVKGIGLTLDDILRYQINSKMALNKQPVSVKIGAAFTMIMFVAGLINSISSVITFRNKKLRIVGCGTYLLASSITSLLTISMFTIQFWFIVIIQMNKSINLSILKGGCKSIEFLLKLFFFFDTWLNACVAIERAISVFKGIHFDKKKSKRIAQWIILILPLVIISTIIHEPLYRKVFLYQIKNRATDKIPIENNAWCVTDYSHSVEKYNTAILFIYLVGPFIANLFSALFIIFGNAYRRSLTQTQQTFLKHIRIQWKEHKQLVISPIILLILSTPRLIISLVSECVNASHNSWLYLSAYFISFIPSILMFAVFVAPSKVYRKTFKESVRAWRQRIRR